MIGWAEFKSQAENMAVNEALLSTFLNECIISSNSYGESAGKLLALNFAGIIAFESWKTLFIEVFTGGLGKYEGEELGDLILQDLQAICDRDPACHTLALVSIFINFKGFKALQSHRVAHILWIAGRRDSALAVQGKCSALWSVDIHPGARIGGGLMLDHGTGVVIGETAVVGRNCSFLHGVTLGSTGKDDGDRHPKIGDDVLIGCNAIILGNITVGNSSKIGSGSVVIKSIPSHSTAVGNPARIVGRSEDTKAASEMDLALKNVIAPCGTLFRDTWALWAHGRLVFEDIDDTGKGYIIQDDMNRVLRLKFHFLPTQGCMDLLFKQFDTDLDGRISKSEFELMVAKLQPQPAAVAAGAPMLPPQNSLCSEKDRVDNALAELFRKLNTNIYEGEFI